MKFSDNLIRDQFSAVFVKRSEKEMEESDESSNLVDVERYNISFDTRTYSHVNIYSVPAREVKIGEDIYDKEGNFIAYRSN